jgi:hypothetical protein
VAVAAGGTFAVAASTGDSVSPWWGLAAGALVGAIALLMARLAVDAAMPTEKAFAALDEAQQREVARAVFQGRRVSDPRLAPTAVLVARQRQLTFVPGPRFLTNGIGLAVLGGLLAAMSVLSTSLGSAVIGLGMVALGLVQNLQQRRAARAEEANLHLGGA